MQVLDVYHDHDHENCADKPTLKAQLSSVLNWDSSYWSQARLNDITLYIE